MSRDLTHSETMMLHILKARKAHTEALIARLVHGTTVYDNGPRLHEARELLKATNKLIERI